MVTANVDLTLGLWSPASRGIFWSKMGTGFQFMVIGNGYKRTNKGQFNFSTVQFWEVYCNNWIHVNFGGIENRATQ